MKYLLLEVLLNFSQVAGVLYDRLSTSKLISFIIFCKYPSFPVLEGIIDCSSASFFLLDKYCFINFFEISDLRAKGIKLS